MNEPTARLSLVTLGVSDLAKSTAFYEALGFRRRSRGADGVAFFEAGGVILSLWPTAELMKDAEIASANPSDVARLELHLSLGRGSCIGASDGRGSDADPVRADCVLGRLYCLLRGSRRASLGSCAQSALSVLRGRPLASARLRARRLSPLFTSDRAR
jgi:catechol 2,3-dioxygenase-like lactoylglutathione lyase family enzyme